MRCSPFGPVAAVWSAAHAGPRVVRIFLSSPGRPPAKSVAKFFPGAQARTSPKIEALLERIGNFLEGKSVTFGLGEIRLDLCSPFQRKVLRAQCGVRRGRLSTYRSIADRLGNRGASRAVGAALAANPFPILIPCHRTIRSDGALGGYQGGRKMKTALLKMEGNDILTS